MAYKTYTESEKTFISAYETLRDGLLEGLLETRERSRDAWRPYWEVQSLLSRLYSGEEKIVKNPGRNISLAD